MYGKIGSGTVGVTVVVLVVVGSVRWWREGGWGGGLGLRNGMKLGEGGMEDGGADWSWGVGELGGFLIGLEGR